MRRMNCRCLARRTTVRAAVRPPSRVMRSRRWRIDERLRLGERYVYILENLARRNAENAIGRLNEVIAFASGVLAAQRVGEAEAGGELFGLDEKTSAVRDPRIGCFHELGQIVSRVFAPGRNGSDLTMRASVSAGVVPSRFNSIFLERAIQNVRAKRRAVNSVFLVQLRKWWWRI
jgi:hypothetical protein